MLSIGKSRVVGPGVHRKGGGEWDDYLYVWCIYASVYVYVFVHGCMFGVEVE